MMEWGQLVQSPRWLTLCAMVAWLGGCAGVSPVPEEESPGPETVAVAPQQRRESLQAAEKAARQRLRELEKRRAEDQQLAALSSIGRRYEELLTRPGTAEERKPELLLRLAELAYRNEEAALREAYESGGEPESPPGQRYLRSLSYYRRLAESYPDSPQALTAYYNLGYLYAEEGRNVLSAWAYQQVIDRDPETPYADEIHMRLGEAIFEEGSPEDAVPHYLAVIAGGRREYLDKAYYKLGWCYYNLENYAAAVAAFTRVLTQGADSPEDLRSETVGVMARSLLEWGGLPRLQEYLAEQSPEFEYAAQLYLLLGELYMESSRYDMAVAAYVAGVEDRPTAAECLDMEEGIIRSLLIARDQRGAMVRRESWLDRYGPDSAWQKAHGAGELAERRDTMVEEGLRLTALFHHSAAQRGQGSLERALELYQQYLEHYGSDTEQGYELAFAHAQALMEAGRAAAAATRYRTVAVQPRWTAHREDASYRRIAALEELYREQPDRLAELAAAHEEYVVLNPDSELVPEVLFAEAELFFTAGRFAAARQVFTRVVQGYPEHELRGNALERISRCFFREEAFPETETACREALAVPQEPDVRIRIRKLLAFSIFKQAEESEQTGDLHGANENFFRLAAELPEEEAAPVALYRGAENLRQLGEAGAAARVFDRLAREYPGSEYGHSALVLSARIFASLGDWGEAARGYTAIYRADPDADAAPDALFAAARAWEQAGKPADAARLYGEFSTVYPEQPRMAEALYREGRILHQGDRDGDAERRFRAAWDSADGGDVDDIYRALAALALGKMRLEAFEQVRLAGDLAEALTRKEELLGEALAFLAQAASLPFAESLTEALYRAGAAFEHMQQALLGSERPAGLSDEELEEYDFLLEEKAFPLEQRAVGYYRRGTRAAREAAVHTQWVERMYERLEELLPWAYRRQEVPAVAWVLPPLVLPAQSPEPNPVVAAPPGEAADKVTAGTEGRR